jgi:hypothetical protein
MVEPETTEREHELAATKRHREEESMRGVQPAAEASPPQPAQIPEPYPPPDELDLPEPDPSPDEDDDED